MNRGRCARIPTLLLVATLASTPLVNASTEPNDAAPVHPAENREPYGLQRFDRALEGASRAASPLPSNVCAALLGALAGAALLAATRRLRARRKAPANGDTGHDVAPPESEREAVDTRTRDPAVTARDALRLALETLDRDPRLAANEAAGALRTYGAMRWIVDLRALTTAEIQRALAESSDAATIREFIRLLSRYDAERYQDERDGALALDAVRTCIETSIRFVDDIAPRGSRG